MSDIWEYVDEDGVVMHVEVPWWLEDDCHGSDEAEYASWLRGLPDDVRADYLAGPWTGAGELEAAGFLHHDSGPSGLGFAAGGAYDILAPGPELARRTAMTVSGGHAQLGESELIGVLCAWQRLVSWAQAGQVAAVIALTERRKTQSAELNKPHLAEHLDDELAAALRLTSRSADRLLSVAASLDRLADVRAALERGEIDWAKACLFVDQLADLSDDIASDIVGSLLDRSGAMTTGLLRAVLARAVLAADPKAAERRKESARKDAQVQVWTEPSGNSALAGRELVPTDVIHATVRLTALARWLKAHGAGGTLDQLRAAAYIALLTGRSVESLLTVAADAAAESTSAQTATGDGDNADTNDATAGSPITSAARTGSSGRSAMNPMAHTQISPAALAGPAARGWPALTGTVNLTMTLAAWAGLTGTPGEVAGIGPVDAATSRDLSDAMDCSARWCLTVIDPLGRALAHACTRHGPRPATGPDGDMQKGALAWAAGLRPKLQTLETEICRHRRQSASYKPPASLRHLIEVRQPTCSAPGCRRAARRCDLDHTIPYAKNGKTCECNLGPLCRRHHRAKQAPGWHLSQPQPGHMTWRLPSGRTYETVGDPY